MFTFTTIGCAFIGLLIQGFLLKSLDNGPAKFWKVAVTGAFAFAAAFCMAAGMNILASGSGIIADSDMLTAAQPFEGSLVVLATNIWAYGLVAMGCVSLLASYKVSMNWCRETEIQY